MGEPDRAYELATRYIRMVSKRGWVEVDYNPGIWIPCPPFFPDGFDRQSWARTCAELWWTGSGLTHGSDDADRLTAMLESVHESTYADLSCQLAWIHLPDPRLLPLPLRVGIWATRGERDAQLRLLANADDPAALQPPDVTEFRTENLGTGLRTLRHLHIGGSVCAALNYAWRSEEHETALRLFTATPDLGRLHRAIPDIEEFARAASVVARKGAR